MKGMEGLSELNVNMLILFHLRLRNGVDIAALILQRGILNVSELLEQSNHIHYNSIKSIWKKLPFALSITPILRTIIAFDVTSTFITTP